MPYSTPKPCLHYGCPKYRTKNGYCEDHQSDYVPRSKKDNREPSSKRGYDTAWNLFAKTYKRRHPVCNRCGRPTSVVHHIIELDDGGDKYADDNLEPLCRTCHEKHHGRL